MHIYGVDKLYIVHSFAISVKLSNIISQYVYLIAFDFMLPGIHRECLIQSAIVCVMANTIQAYVIVCTV